MQHPLPAGAGPTGAGAPSTGPAATAEHPLHDYSAFGTGFLYPTQWIPPVVAGATGGHADIADMYSPASDDEMGEETEEAGETATRNRHLEEAQKLEEMRKNLLEEMRQTKYRASLLREIRRRKYQRILALVLTFLAFVETLLIVTTIVKPVPQFALEGNLFYVQSLNADQYTKRDHILLPDNGYLNLEVDIHNNEADILNTRLSISRKRRLQQRQTKTNPVPATKFVAFWFGAMGACLQQASGAIICSGGLTTDFRILYDQSRLSRTVLAALPDSTGLAPVGYLVGCCLNALFIIYLTVVTLWPKWMWTPLRPGTSWDRRFQFTVGSVSFLTIGALAAFTISTIQIRNKYVGAIQSIPALDSDLVAQFDKGFNSLYGACVVGAIEVLGCIFLTWYTRERDQKLNYKWAKAPAPVTGNWNRAESIMKQSDAGSAVGSGSGKVTMDTTKPRR